MARKGWYEALADALQQDNATPYTVMQLATIDTSSQPRVRSLVHREFLTASTVPNVPLILTTTDVRTPKVIQLEHERRIEVLYWVPPTQEQFRITGLVSVVPAPEYGGAYPAPTGVVYKALCDEGFDWEAKRVETFDRMGGRLKAGWCRPVPGTPLGEDGEEEMRRWPERLPKMGEAVGEEEKRNLETALSNFALVLVEPVWVDYVELGGELDRRTRFERCLTDEGVVGWKATLVVP